MGPYQHAYNLTPGLSLHVGEAQLVGLGRRSAPPRHQLHSDKLSLFPSACQ